MLSSIWCVNCFRVSFHWSSIETTALSLDSQFSNSSHWPAFCTKHFFRLWSLWCWHKTQVRQFLYLCYMDMRLSCLPTWQDQSRQFVPLHKLNHSWIISCVVECPVVLRLIVFIDCIPLLVVWVLILFDLLWYYKICLLCKQLYSLFQAHDT